MRNPFANRSPVPPAAAPQTAPAASSSNALSQARRRWPGVVARLFIVMLALAAGALGYGFWMQRQALEAQNQALAALTHQRQGLLLAARRIQSERDARERSLEQRERELLALQTENQRLEAEQRQVSEAHQRLEAEMRSALQLRDVTISELAGKLTVNILDRVLFDSGESSIKPEGQAVLRQVAGILDRFPNRQIQVLGHTDNVPIRTARFPSNWELSAARAIAAVRFLTEEAGVDPRQIGALGYGEYHPIADNSTPEGRAQNRRIAIVVLPEILPPPIESTEPAAPRESETAPADIEAVTRDETPGQDGAAAAAPPTDPE